MVGDEVKKGKPHPEIFLEAAQRLGNIIEVLFEINDWPKESNRDHIY